MAKKAPQGTNAATLEVVIEAAGLIMYSQKEGLGPHTAQVGRPPLVAGLSQLSTAVASQLLMVVASQLPQPLLQLFAV